MAFSESLVLRDTPWAACAAWEDFVSQGNQCRTDDGINWIGILSLCESRMRHDASKSPRVLVAPPAHEALAWAHLVISISESCATSQLTPPFGGWLYRAMSVRTEMILRFNNYTKDPVCDVNAVVAWCMAIPEVDDLVKMARPPRAVIDIEPDARLAAEMIKELITAGKLKSTETIARLLNIIEQAQKHP